MSVLSAINKYAFGPAMLFVLFGVGLYFCIRFRFFNILHPIRIVRVLLRKSHDPNAISPFKALTIALAGTLGVGNIVGVSTAIAAGGPGAVFWMWLSALVSMLIKYSEIVLAIHYRRHDGARWYGGAAYYIRDGLGYKKLAAFFSLLCISASFTIGNIVQIKAVSDAFESVFSLKPIICGIIIAIITFTVIFGGIKSIADFTVKLIPALSIAYIFFSMFIIIANFELIPNIFSDIIEDAFTPNSAVGGIGGFLLMRSIRYGMVRGIASNEAGCGTAPTAHAAANTKSPVEQGFWGIFEVFVDTIVLCTMTAFVILISFDSLIGYDGMVLAIKAYEAYFGNAAGWIMSFSIFFFALGTIICWSYYGIESVRYFTKRTVFSKIYIFIYCILIIYGSVSSAKFIWELSDFSVGLMTVINTLCLLPLSGTVNTLTKNYFRKTNRRMT